MCGAYGLPSLTSRRPHRTAESKGAWDGAGHGQLPDGGNQPCLAHYSARRHPTAAGAWLRLTRTRDTQAAARRDCRWLGPPLLAHERCAATASSAPASGTESAARLRARAEESLVRPRCRAPLRVSLG